MSNSTSFPLTEWQPAFSVNLEFIDNHHKKFLELINEMKRTLNQKSCETDLSLIFIKLIHYTENYFQEEEMYFKQLDYPNFGHHRDQHNRFIADVRDFHARFAASEPDICKELLRYLDDFFQTHILGYDREAVQFLMGKGMK